MFGQGARFKTLDEQQMGEELLNTDDEQKMLMAFSAENHMSKEFDWNQYYGSGFNALNFKVLNSILTDEEKR